MHDVETQEPTFDPTVLQDHEALAEVHPADVAEYLEQIEPEAAAEMLVALPAETAASVLAELDVEQAQGLLSELPPRHAATALAQMPLDDAADLAAELSSEIREAVLSALPSEHRAELEDLLTYPEETAGGLMSPEVVALRANMTANDAIVELRRIADESEQIYYSYVVDHQHRLVGVLSLRDLILAPADRQVHEFMIEKIVSVPATMDREEVAAIFRKYGYYALPVVADDSRLLGVVTVDDVISVLEEEATEDMQLMVGAGGDEHADTPVLTILRYRTPWLLVNLALALGVVTVIGQFEQQLATLTALAVFMPLVANQAGNAGAQSMAVMIRSLATGERTGGVWRVITKNMLVGLATGVVVAIFAGTIGFVWKERLDLALVLGVALVLCMMLAAVSGALTPWLMKRCGFDPAQSSSIILLAITDLAGFGLFLTLGAWLVAAT